MLEIPLESIFLIGWKKLYVGKIIKKELVPYYTYKFSSQILLSETLVNGLAEQAASIVHKFYDAYVGFAALNKANFSMSSLNLRRTRCNFETLWITTRIVSWSLRLTLSSREGKYLHLAKCYKRNAVARIS